MTQNDLDLVQRAIAQRSCGTPKTGELPGTPQQSDATSAAPKTASAYYDRGVDYAKKRDLDRAIADFDKAIELDPKPAFAYVDRGNAYGHKGDLERAVADYGKASALNPKDARAYYGRGVAYDKKGDCNRALADFNKASGLNPKLAGPGIIPGQPEAGSAPSETVANARACDTLSAKATAAGRSQLDLLAALEIAAANCGSDASATAKILLGFGEYCGFRTGVTESEYQRLSDLAQAKFAKDPTEFCNSFAELSSRKAVLCESITKSGATPTSIAATLNIIATNCDEPTRALGRGLLAILDYCGFHIDTTASAYRRIFDSTYPEFRKNPEQACKITATAFAFAFNRSLSGTPAPPKEVSGTASADWLIVPGERIGALRLDGKIDDIVKLLGPGTQRPFAMWSFSKLLTWDAMGVWTYFDPGTGNVLWLAVEEASGSHALAEYSTPEGVRIGSKREEVESALGPPERTVSGGGTTSLYYDRRGLRLELGDVGPLAGKVGGIRVVWPSLPRGDSLIVPGRRISNIEVGMPVERALTVLGGGYHRGEGSLGSHDYYWPHLGLSLVETGGYVHSVRASRDSPSDAAGIRYATREEISLGSSTSDIKEELGEPSRTQSPTKGLQSWIYDSRGIAFFLDNTQKVRGIDVFRSGWSIADFNKAIELDPKDAYTYDDRGATYAKKGDLDRAIADYNKAIELDPQYAPAYNNRGIIYDKKADLDRAIADFDKAIELDPKLAPAYNNRANAYAKNGDVDRAIADLTRVIRLDPKNAVAYNNRAMVYFEAGKAAQGLPDVEKSLELRPDDPLALDTRGHIFEALGRREEAIADFRRALAKAPQLQESKDALRRLGASP